MTRNTDFSLRGASLSSVTWYATVVAGWGLIALAAFSCATAGAIDMPAAFAMVGVIVLVLELLPVVLGRGHDPQGIVMSTAFVSAMMFVWGVWPAVVIIAVASLGSDIRARKEWWKAAFNPAQYALSVGASYLVMLGFGEHQTLARPLRDFGVHDLAWAAGTWVVYYIVNLVLVLCVISFRGPFVRLLMEDLAHGTAMMFAVLGLSPLVAVVALSAPALLPLLLVPLLLLYYTAQMSLKREYEASHDPLTGLGNRASMQFDLEGALAEYRQDGVPFGLIVIDLDDFKIVNDTLGHHVGDALLVEFGRRLSSCLRASDHVARLGGDEFAVIVSDADETDALVVAQRIKECVAQPVELSEVALQLDVSVGVALCPTHGEDATTLMRRADIAMYAAKESRTLVELFESERDDGSTNRLALLGELRNALQSDQIELHYQPKVCARTGVLLGMEALLRWRHPVQGYIPPDAFIPFAERSGIMPEVTRRVIDLALAQMASWRDDGFRVRVAVNVAPSDLIGSRIVDYIEERLAHHGVPAAMLRLEITERMVAHRLDETSHTLERLRKVGVTVSLDDFGTGYSSLLRLSTLPVDEIKIDRVFVAPLAGSLQAVGIVKALIDLAHALGVPAIAEGVETEDERQVLWSLGCDGIQGWHVARPMPVNAATDWLRDHYTTFDAAEAQADAATTEPDVAVVTVASVETITPAEVVVEPVAIAAGAENLSLAASLQRHRVAIASVPSSRPPRNGR